MYPNILKMRRMRRNMTLMCRWLGTVQEILDVDSGLHAQINHSQLSQQCISHNLQNTTQQFLVVVCFAAFSIIYISISYKIDILIIMDNDFLKIFKYRARSKCSCSNRSFSRVSSNMSKFGVLELHVSQCGKD